MRITRIVAQQIVFTLKVVIYCLWPATVSAAAAIIISNENPFGDISGLQILIMSAISTLSGLTALTIRIDSEIRKYKNKPLSRPVLFASSHMMGSWLSGILAFAIAQHNMFGIWWQIIIIIFASFSGAKFVEKLSEAYITKNSGSILPQQEQPK